MTVHRQHSHHRPRVVRGRVTGRWYASCETCGWRNSHFDWHVTLIRALFHSESLT